LSGYARFSSHKALARKLEELERKIGAHDEQIQAVFQAIRQLMIPPEEKRRKIGFLVKEKAARYGGTIKDNPHGDERERS
jgi:uncharacterized membrane protein